jgi:hypothetical protein
VKPETIIGKTFGNVTYEINVLGVKQGRDVEAQERYTSMARSSFVNQNTIIQRTAAEIVGIKKSDLAKVPFA